MKLSKARLTGAAALVAVAGAVTVGAPLSEAQQYNPPKPKSAVISAVLKGKKLKFTGSGKVDKGAKLTVQNLTKARKVGPHTFSLTDADLVPRGKTQRKACGRDLAGVCLDIFKAHKVDPETFEVGKPDVDVGKKGWDRSFGKKGDTWYSETEDETETRVVSAKAGTTLTLFCVVHPEMVKKLKVK